MHWGQDKMDTILHITFSNAFSLTKIFEFRLQFHWRLSWAQLAVSQHWCSRWFVTELNQTADCCTGIISSCLALIQRAFNTATLNLSLHRLYKEARMLMKFLSTYLAQHFAANIFRRIFFRENIISNQTLHIFVAGASKWHTLCNGAWVQCRPYRTLRVLSFNSTHAENSQPRMWCLQSLYQMRYKRWSHIFIWAGMLSIDIEWLNGLQERFGIRIYSGQIYASIFYVFEIWCS